jgi:radical SAM superfamily enzyme YgiQ (UPF0313 family)
METFKNSGRYIRRKSPVHFIKEMRAVKERYPTKSLFLCDDLFATDIKWLEEFAELYRKEIDLPYICTARADVIKEKHARLLADSGCHTISFGLETGSEQLRKNILRKNISNADIAACARTVKEAGIEIQTSNMFCLPDETVPDAVSTIEFNAEIGTNYMFSTVFLPFPKTALADYCIQKGILKKGYSFKDMPHSFISDSVLEIKDKAYLINLHQVSHLCTRFPRLKKFLIFLARRIKCRKLFLGFWFIGTVVRFKEERKLKPLQVLQYLWSYRKGL